MSLAKTFLSQEIFVTTVVDLKMILSVAFSVDFYNLTYCLMP